MGGTSATGVKAIGKGAFKQLQTRAKDFNFKSPRHKRLFMQRASRNIAWAQKNSRFIQGKGAGRTAAQQMMKQLGSTGFVQRSSNKILNKAGRAAMKAGKLNMTSGAAGRDPLATTKDKGGTVLPRRKIPGSTPGSVATPGRGGGGRFRRGSVS